MSKDRQRGNREVKKPKKPAADKASASPQDAVAAPAKKGNEPPKKPGER